MRTPPLTAAALLLATLAPPATTRADTPPAKLRTQTVPVKVVRDAQDVAAKRDRAIELVQLPAGTIVLTGPDVKAREHAIKPIWMARHETRWDEYDVFWQGLDMTDEQWRAWWRQYSRNTPEDRQRSWRRMRGMDERPEDPYFPPYGYEEKAGRREYLAPKGRPADTIHVQAARKYCAWLSRHTGRKFRLPTEAEWEYACRAGGPPLKPDGKALDAVAWFAGNTADDRPQPVGRKRPNAWGLYDMLGNVGEYVVRDPADDKGLLAGGSYKDVSKDVHSGAREQYSPDWQRSDPQEPKSTNWFIYDVHHAGFRVVMEE